MTPEGTEQTPEEFYEYHATMTNLRHYCTNAGTMRQCPQCKVGTNPEAKECRNYAERGG